MTTHVATVFDKNYLVRAIALRNSLYKFSPESSVWLLCLDEESYSAAKKLELKNTKIVSLDEINDVELLTIKNSRTGVEFAMGSKASFLKYILDSGEIKQNDQFIFVDADILFYSPAQKTFEKAFNSGSSIVLTAHKYPKEKKHLESRLGYYNSGLIFFKNDGNARKCIEEWRKQCIEWCSVVCENGKYTDQAYLNNWPKRYKALSELPDKGVNMGTWNIKNYKITSKDNLFYIDDEILVCYHAHGLRIYLDKELVAAYPITIFHSGIYKQYLAALQEAYLQIRAVEPLWIYGFVKKPDIFRLLKQRVIRYFRDFKFTSQYWLQS